MVLAHAFEADVLLEHHLVVLLREGFLQNLARVFVQAGKELGVRSRDALRSIGEPFAVRIFADCQENLSDRGTDALLVHGGKPGLIVHFYWGPARVGC